MKTGINNRSRSHSAAWRASVLVISAAATLLPGWVAFGQTSPEPPSGAPQVQAHMSQAHRTSVKKVVVIAGQSPVVQSVTGSYEQATEGLVEGIDSGSRIGTISKEIGGVPISFPIPMLTIPGAIFGGLSGAAKREIQEFRDALTDELSQAGNQTLSSDGLAADVYFELRNLPHLQSKIFARTTPLTSDIDAILYVGLNDITIDVQGKEAVLTASARATLRRVSDGSAMYENIIQYQDRDTLSNWTDNDNALWRDFVNFARHYLGREISAQVFDRVELRHELQPVKTDTVARIKKNPWQGVSRSTTPTLAWDLALLGGDTYGTWADSIDESNIYYDIEIYDPHQLVYAEYQVQGSSHTLAMELPDCQTYQWSVRPSYRVDNGIKFGEWMRTDAHTDTGDNGAYGIFGEEASAAPAYIQHFASLKIECGRK